MARPRGAKERAGQVVKLLAELYPDVRCALNHSNAYELLVATILSAQSTDVRVNMVTPACSRSIRRPSISRAPIQASSKTLIQSTGFFHAKAKSLIGMATAVENDFKGEVPDALDDLVTLPGVGRKTGNVVRSVWFDEPGFPVDTHVTRLSKRLEAHERNGPGEDRTRCGRARRSARLGFAVAAFDRARTPSV